jgi:hypothetical protein
VELYLLIAQYLLLVSSGLSALRISRQAYRLFNREGKGPTQSVNNRLSFSVSRATQVVYRSNYLSSLARFSLVQRAAVEFLALLLLVLSQSSLSEVAGSLYDRFVQVL